MCVYESVYVCACVCVCVCVYVCVTKAIQGILKMHFILSSALLLLIKIIYTRDQSLLFVAYFNTI